MGKKLLPAHVELSKYFFTTKSREISKDLFRSLRATSFTKSGTDFITRFRMRFRWNPRWNSRWNLYEISSKNRHGLTIHAKQFDKQKVHDRKHTGRCTSSNDLKNECEKICIIRICRRNSNCGLKPKAFFQRFYRTFFFFLHNRFSRW